MPDTAKMFKKNIKKKCVQDGYNWCFNDTELKYHNSYRKQHKAKKFILDVKIAKKAQTYLDALVKKAGKGKTAVLKASAKAKRFNAKCGENIYTYKGKAATDLLRKNIASKAWYDTKKFYDFKKGGPKKKADKKKMLPAT
jgi:hypothetical protein